MSKLKIISDKEGIPDIIKSAISAEIRRLEIGLNKTNREIKKFEEEYKIPSEVFLTQLTAEDLKGEDDEYIRWAGELKIRQRILEDLEKLREIEYASK